MNIKMIQADNTLWEIAMKYAKNCSWKDGVDLAKRMQDKEFTDFERVFVAVEESNIAGFCTILKTQDVPNNIYTPFIGYMFVSENYRGQRVSEKLITSALHYAKNIGFSEAYLVSNLKGLYEKYGFAINGDLKNIWGNGERLYRINL